MSRFIEKHQPRMGAHKRASDTVRDQLWDHGAIYPASGSFTKPNIDLRGML